MKQINQFVLVVEESKIIERGKYKVGRDILSGEYYCWGKIEYTILHNGETESYVDFDEDSYATFEEDDRIEVQNGFMTHSSNISYRYSPQNLLCPGHRYRVGREIPMGFYIFCYRSKYFKEKEAFLEEDEAEFASYKLYEGKLLFGHMATRGKYGCVEVKEDTLYVAMINGCALYYGNEAFDEIKIIDEKFKSCFEYKKYYGKSLIKNQVLNM